MKGIKTVFSFFNMPIKRIPANKTKNNKCKK